MSLELYYDVIPRVMTSLYIYTPVQYRGVASTRVVSVKINNVFKMYAAAMQCDLNSTNQRNFQSLEVVDRGSETQLHVTENRNELT